MLRRTLPSIWPDAASPLANAAASDAKDTADDPRFSPVPIAWKVQQLVCLMTATLRGPSDAYNKGGGIMSQR